MSVEMREYTYGPTVSKIREAVITEAKETTYIDDYKNNS